MMFLKGSSSSGSARKMFEDKRWSIGGKPIVLVNRKPSKQQTTSTSKNKRNAPPDAEKVSAPSIIENVRITNKLLKISLDNTNKQNKLLQEIVDSLGNKKSSGSGLLPTVATIGRLVSGLGKIIGRVIGGLLRRYIAPLIAAVGRYIAKGVRYLGRGIAKFSRGRFTNFSDKFKNFLKNSFSKIKEFGGKAKNFIKNSWSNVKNFTGKAKNFIKNTWSTAKETFKKYGPIAKEFVSNKFKSAISSFRQFAEKMRTPKLPPLKEGFTFDEKIKRYRNPNGQLASEADARGVSKAELKELKNRIEKSTGSTLFKPETNVKEAEKIIPKTPIKSFSEKIINNRFTKIIGGVLGSKVLDRLLFAWSVLDPSSIGKDEDLLSFKTKLDDLNEQISTVKDDLKKLEERNKKSGGFGINYAKEITEKKNRINQLNEQIRKEQKRMEVISGQEGRIAPTPEMNNGLFGRISYDQDKPFNKKQYSKIIFEASSIKFISDKFTFNQNKDYGYSGSNYNSGGFSNASYSPPQTSTSSSSSSSPSSSTYTPQEGDIVKVIEAGPGYNVVQFDDGRVERRVGDRSWRNNNPGNLDYGAYARSKGAIASDGKSAIFPNMDAGRSAHQNILWELGLYRGKTIEQAINIYAPPFENDTESYIRRICAAAGVTRNMLLSDMTPEQRQKMIAAMEVIEGNTRSGKITIIKPAETTNKPVSASLQNGINLASASMDYSDQKQNIKNASISVPVPIPVQNQQNGKTILATSDYMDSVSLSDLIKSQTMAA